MSEMDLEMSKNSSTNSLQIKDVSGLAFCAVIPTYNNPATIVDVVGRVRAYGLDVVVVNDGSSEPAAGIIMGLVGQPGVYVVSRPVNGGKGAAVKDGLLEAKKLGYSHALQIDADGQHNFQDIPRFIEEAQKNPTTLILGCPQFDESVPKARLWGRQITIFWTRVETLGSTITDPMCGFRVYPLEAATAVRVQGDRMDFDPEIAVRMVWAGVPVLNLTTQVKYLRPEDGGVSHFRMFWDNVAISWMHTRLVFEGIFLFMTWPLRCVLGIK